MNVPLLQIAGLQKTFRSPDGERKGIVSGVAAVIRAQIGVLLETFAYNRVVGWAPLAMVALCALCGLIPAWKAYRTDVADNLAATS